MKLRSHMPIPLFVKLGVWLTGLFMMQVSTIGQPNSYIQALQIIATMVTAIVLPWIAWQQGRIHTAVNSTATALAQEKTATAAAHAAEVASMKAELDRAKQDLTETKVNLERQRGISAEGGPRLYPGDAPDYKVVKTSIQETGKPDKPPVTVTKTTEETQQEPKT